jgi:predicted transposase YbfD/YdcC
MPKYPSATLIEHFSDLEDPRIDRGKLHPLINILTIALCGAICGADSWVDIELFGEAKQEWFSQFLDMTNGVPSHDTFGRVFSLLDAEQFQNCFIKWVEAICEVLDGQVVAIDGKTLRRSHDRATSKKAIHMVSAWAAENQVVLGQTKVDDKSNEITAIPTLLELLDVSDCIITIDAMGCQRKIAQQIIEQGADYVLALKGNQGRIHQDAVTLFEDAEAINYEDCDHCRTVSKGHDRIDIRECWTTADPEYLNALYKPEQWAELQTVAKVYSERRLKDKTESETRYYISSLPGDNAKLLLDAIRTHWHIENRLHWVLDVTFHEDGCRIRKGNAAQNMAILRHMALNLLKQEQSTKRSIRGKRLKAGWDERYLTQILCAH